MRQLEKSFFFGLRSSARWGRDSLCPAGAAFVSTMPAPSGFLDGAGCEKIVGS